MDFELADFINKGADMALTKPLVPAQLDELLRYVSQSGCMSPIIANLSLQFMGLNIVRVPKSSVRSAVEKEKSFSVMLLGDGEL
jgi:hypothetical protein